MTHRCATLLQHILETNNVGEPSHSRGAPDVPEPLILGAQYLTRYNTWKNSFVSPDRRLYALYIVLKRTYDK